MKKIFIGFAVLALSSCFLEGDYTLGMRNKFNDFFYTYNIRYYDLDSFTSSATETETISNYKVGVARHAVTGGLVLSTKIVQKQVYSDDYVRPNKKGALVSYTVPVEFSDEVVYQTIGESDIHGITYRLLAPNRYGDILLIDGMGRIYNRVGRIYNNRLALLDTTFVLEPEDAVFMDETKNRDGDENVVSGFSVRYEGLDDYRMKFRFTGVNPDGSYSNEQGKIYTFPVYDKTVSFEGITLEILEADEQGLDYKVLEI